jgi:hypothetical protein
MLLPSEVMHIAGNREDFVKIVKAQVRLPRIIHGEECLLQQALSIEAGGLV